MGDMRTWFGFSIFVGPNYCEEGLDVGPPVQLSWGSAHIWTTKPRRMKITWKRQSMGNDKYRSPTSTMKAKVEEQEEFRGRKALDSSDGHPPNNSPRYSLIFFSFPVHSNNCFSYLFFFPSVFSGTKQDSSFGFVCTVILLG